MAKKKAGAREYVSMECDKCASRNYRTSKNNRNTKKLEIPKFCQRCRAHTMHKERKK